MVTECATDLCVSENISCSYGKEKVIILCSSVLLGWLQASPEHKLTVTATGLLVP